MKKCIILVASVLTILFGCKKADDKVVSYPPPTKIISALDASLVMYSTNITCNSHVLADAKYLLPTKRWIEQDFSSGLWQFQTEMGISTWVADANDCDKFSNAASFYAKWLNYSTANRNVSAAIAIGELYYFIGGYSNKGHAINFFIILGNDGQLQMVCYEPQTRKIVTLTDAERASVFFWKL